MKKKCTIVHSVKEMTLTAFNPWNLTFLQPIKIKTLRIGVRRLTRSTKLRIYWWPWRISKFRWCLCFWGQVEKCKLKSYKTIMKLSIRNICMFLALKPMSRKNKTNQKNSKVNLNFYSFKNLNSLEDRLNIK